MATLAIELAEVDSGVGVHLFQPGLVMTEGLKAYCEGNTKFWKFVNILAEKPAVVANFAVPKFRAIHTIKSHDINFLTMGSAIGKFVTGMNKHNRFINEETGELMPGALDK